jgi:hypothetical protein
MNDQPDLVDPFGLEQVTYQQIDGFGRHAFATVFGRVDLIGKFILIQIIDGLEEFDMPEDLIVREDYDEHAVIFAPKAGLLELLVEGGLCENAMWEKVATVVDVNVISVS